jgi:hypothetical protein
MPSYAAFAHQVLDDLAGSAESVAGWQIADQTPTHQ